MFRSVISSLPPKQSNANSEISKESKTTIQSTSFRAISPIFLVTVSSITTSSNFCLTNDLLATATAVAFFYRLFCRLKIMIVCFDFDKLPACIILNFPNRYRNPLQLYFHSNLPLSLNYNKLYIIIIRKNVSKRDISDC